jgi:sortase (surface protein transpeptidase)
VIIPDVGVDASVVPVGATPDGIEVPPVFEAGWYAEGPRPSEPGRAIVLGHLDSLTGPAAFTQIPQARRGSEVTVVDRAGVSHPFQVLRTLEVAKSSFPADEVYGGTRRPSLALITCGGEFNPVTGYENNVIVFARELRRS